MNARTPDLIGAVSLAVLLAATACSDDDGGVTTDTGDVAELDGTDTAGDPDVEDTDADVLLDADADADGDAETDADADADTDADATEPGILLDDPLGEFPVHLSETGLYPDMTDRAVVDPRAHLYVPLYQLWSNGSHKERYIVVPAGESIDTSERGAWSFPTGTLFFKTFAYPDVTAPNGFFAIETRLLRHAESGWEFAVYQWNGEQTEADLLDMQQPVAVPVSTEADGEFEHQIPSRLQCRTCHESEPRFIIGFDELRLTAPLQGHAATQLEELDTAELFSVAVPETPEVVEAETDQDRAVIGYIHGNCAHCHNGFQTPQAQFDLRHPVFLANTINQESVVGGLRITPGAPGESVVFLRFSGEGGLGVGPMPPLGVQVRDRDAIERLRTWIETLPSE